MGPFTVCRVVVELTSTAFLVAQVETGLPRGWPDGGPFTWGGASQL